MLSPAHETPWNFKKLDVLGAANSFQPLTAGRCYHIAPDSLIQSEVWDHPSAQSRSKPERNKIYGSESKLCCRVMPGEMRETRATSKIQFTWGKLVGLGGKGTRIWVCPSPKRHEHPQATYSFLNGSQAQIAHHCLEPELSGERGRKKREGGVSFGTLYGIINTKAEINLCRKELSFLLG